jgi:Mg/Co/Ni transporter MgtE
MSLYRVTDILRLRVDKVGDMFRPLQTLLSCVRVFVFDFAPANQNILLLQLLENELHWLILSQMSGRNASK